MNEDKGGPRKWYEAITKTPFRLIVATILVVFLWEITVMLLIPLFVPICPVWTESLLDAFLLATLVLPVLYFFLYRPMKHHIKKRDQAEAALRRSHEKLQKDVNERTVELARMNKELRLEINERRQAEKDLRQEGDKAQRYLDMAGTIILATDTDQKVKLINKSGCEVLGYKEEEVVGKNWFESFVPERFREKRRALFEKLMKGELDQTESHETPILTKNGEEKIIEWQNRRLENDKGVVTGTLSSGKDITELKKAEKEMKLTYQIQTILYKLLQLSMEDFSLSEILARTLDLIVSVPWLQLEEKGCIFLAEGRSLVMVAHKGIGEPIQTRCRNVPFGTCLCGRAAESGKVEFADGIDERHDIHYEGIGPHGHYCVPIPSEDTVLGVICFYLNDGHIKEKEEVVFLESVANAVAGIIERRQNQENLTRLAAAIEASVEAVIITNAEGNIQYVNPAFIRMSGYLQEEAEGRHISIIESGQHEEAYLEKMWKTIGRGEIWSGYFVNRKKDGSLYQVESSISPIRDKSGVIFSYVSVQRDVTREKTLERDLRQAQKMEAIGTLAGGIAHDFNNILSAILGYTEISKMKLDPQSDVQKGLDEVYNAGKRAKDLVRQILAFSRQGEQELSPMIVHPIVKEALKLLRSSIPTTIEIKQTVHKCGTVLADVTQIHQVVMNLCTNAYHAMEEEGGELGVSLSDVDLGPDDVVQYPKLTPGPYIRLSISDTGGGISPQIMERIFEPYFTTKEKGSGTGMGLSVVHGIVTSHGGAIIVESDPGRGSTFHVYLPRIEHEAERNQDQDKPLPKGDERILIIDDEKPLVEMGRQMLEKLGYDVVAMTDSIKSLELFREDPERFDLVITDMTMPHLTGDKLAQQLMEIRPDIPIILSTGFSKQIDEDMALGMGIKAFAMKPLILRDLANTVREVFDGAKG